MASKDRTTRDYIRPGTEEQGRLREDFSFADVDGNEQLTLTEFVRFMAQLDPDMSEEECRIGFEEIDSDRDGVISFDEFRAWWAQT
jgi:Ca2+-binding EF-hand superfamily protein